ncbi:GNAT family N-acetyltransferase [Streptomyces rubradiris]|uniref:N-acetyltransferase n=1 Tax=Streptomyces rubradiris TaxID=285531 RepID=A0ABQ3RBA7_STRRR|nr:GNAT family protein [Streptomyces rubradiris]GHH19480.1 N-acetyltransferase [Streptomyces rubradiris]GHI53102.1 N-acetyltransferase [Streptomyces rubradiris]
MYPVDRSSSRLALRELSPEDVNAVLAIYGSPEATEHLSFEPRSREQVGRIVARSIAVAGETPRGEYALAVIERATSELVGFGRLALDPHQQRGAIMGFALRPRSWGAGYGVEMVRLLLGFGFDDLGLHRIWGARSPWNEASARTMAAAGMVEEGVIREHVLKGGVWRDSVVHAILDREWHATVVNRAAGG